MTLAIEPSQHFAEPSDVARAAPLADELPTIAFVVDGETHALQHVSAFFVDYSGRSVDEVRGDGWRCVVHPDDLSRARETVLAKVERGEPIRVELRILDRHGAYRWHDVRATPACRDGRVDHWRGVCTDVEELRRSEREHAAKSQVLCAIAGASGPEDLQRKFATAITRELADLCVVDLDEPGRARPRRAVISLAPGFDGRLGAPVSREERDRLADLSRAGELRIGPDAQALFAPLPIRSVLVVPLTVGKTHIGHVWLATLGRARPFDASDRPAAEMLVAVLGGSLASLQALEDASRAAHLRDELLAVVSHDLRTPLSTVLGWSRLLKENAADPTRLRRGLDVIERSAIAQTRIIDDLLDASRAVTGKLRLDPQDVSVAAIARDAAEAIDRAATEKRITVTVAVEDDACGAVDADRVRQVLDNLLSNATKFTPVGGRISLTVRTADEFVELLVTDTGVGIDPVFLPHVFDRFRQADSSTTRRQGGLGIGLAIVRAITELHGGSVDAKSDGLGSGATFTVRLPVGSSVPRERRPQPEVPNLAALAKLHVLVVDDEPDARELSSTILSSHGAHVVTAGSANEAMRMLEGARVDLLLSDIGMPEEDGVSLVQRAQAQFPTLPAVALSAYARIEDEQRALAAGFARYLTKPVDPDNLVQTVASLARR